MPRRNKKKINYKDLNDGGRDDSAAELTALQEAADALAREEDISKLRLQVEQQKVAIRRMEQQRVSARGLTPASPNPPPQFTPSVATAPARESAERHDPPATQPPPATPAQER